MIQEQANENRTQEKPRRIKSFKVKMGTLEYREDGPHLVVDFEDVVYESEDLNGGAP